MPANEQTSRNMKLMHVVFGISAVIMLLTTIWMMADDHNRPWKDYQRTFRHVDVQTTRWRADEQKSAGYEKKTHELEQDVAAAQRVFTAADRDHVIELLDKFKERRRSLRQARPGIWTRCRIALRSGIRQSPASESQERRRTECRGA